MTFIESETIELKSSVVADLCKEVIAFANTRGGTLYIGVEDNGTVIGVDSADRVTLRRDRSGGYRPSLLSGQ